MAVRFTVGKFPRNAAVRDATGLPWGCVVQPFAAPEQQDPSPAAGGGSAAAAAGGKWVPERVVLTPADDVARCEDCFAYINPYCVIDRVTWRCALCDVVNTFSDAQLARRYGSRSALVGCAELAGSTVELNVACQPIQEDVFPHHHGDNGGPEPTTPDTAAAAAGASGLTPVAAAAADMLTPLYGLTDMRAELELYKRPAYVAMVDLTGSEDFLELVKSSLLAALEAFTPSAVFGLVTFSDKVGLYDLQGSTPSVRHVSIPPGEHNPLPLDLADVLPLRTFFAPVSLHKDNIAGALETLRPVTPQQQQQAAAKARQDARRGGVRAGRLSQTAAEPLRGFGTAVDAVVKYLGGVRRDSADPDAPTEAVAMAAAAAEAGYGDEVGRFVCARVLVFLSGLPNYGMGQLSAERYFDSLAGPNADADDADKGLFQEQTPFYRDVAEAAMQAGVCVDLFAVSSAAGSSNANGSSSSSEQNGLAADAGATATAATSDASQAAATPNGSDSLATTTPTLPQSSMPGQKQQPQQQAVAVEGLAVPQTPYFDLASLRFLSTGSGGTVFLYGDAADATLPQDMYRMLSRPHAFGGVLRLRTSREFKAVRAYGHFFPDSQYDNLYHIIRCDPYDTYCFDFDYTNASVGFTSHAASASPTHALGPILQLAFQYTVVLPPLAPPEDEGREDAGEGGGGDSGQGAGGIGATWRGKMGGGVQGVEQQERVLWHHRGSVLRRVLRVKTVQVNLARGPRDLYESADNEAILAVLLQKVVRASLEEGVLEGRLLLKDWLVILTAHYNDAYRLAQFGQPATATRLDVAFAACPQLQPLPRIVFALLRSPLLQFHREGVHPDLRTFLQCLYSSLDPSFLLRAIYPVLSSYMAPDRAAFPRHSLSRAALVTSGSPIFLLDAFTTIIVYYVPGAPPDIPFPPPQNSLLRATVNRLKAERILTPRTVFIRGATDDSAPFERFLIEEQDVDGEGGDGAATGMGFVAFLEATAMDVREYMK